MKCFRSLDKLYCHLQPFLQTKLYSLFQIKSLGFRGEALASIGSVAKVRVESMQAGAEAGYYIEIVGFKLFAAIDQVLMAVFFWEDIYEQL